MGETGSGWLPLEATEVAATDEAQDSRRLADRLVALEPRSRVVELMRLASRQDAESRPLRTGDLARVLDSFGRVAAPNEEDLARLWSVAAGAGR